MRLLLINPSQGIRHRHHSDFKTGAQLIDKKIFAFPLALPTVASVTPTDVDVTIVDEEIEPINFDFEADLVGITAMTCKAKRAYQIAEAFRKRGRHVVMGGIHASMLPEEALEHVDTVVAGEAECIWGQVIEDFKNNKIKDFYKSDNFVDLNDYPITLRDLIKNEAYSFHMVQTKRGCPYQCSFCSVQKFNGRRVRTVGAEKVRKEIEQIIRIVKPKFKVKDKSGRIYDGFINIFFTDDNFIINKNHVREICSMLKDVSEKHNIKINWITHADISVAKDDELLQLLSQSGCARVFIGFESLEEDNLSSMNKNCKTSDEYSKAIKKIYSYGMDIISSFIIGYDFDDAGSSTKLIDFTEQMGLYNTVINVLTPFPGTELFFQLEKENRIITKDWAKYTLDKVVFTPKKLTVDELRKIHNQLFLKIFGNRSLYSKLIKRNKEYLQNQNKLVFEPSPNKYLAMFLLNLKTIKILKKEGMPFRNILHIIFYSLKYTFNTDKHLSVQTISGHINFVDKIHYIYWKQNYDNSP